MVLTLSAIRREQATAELTVSLLCTSLPCEKDMDAALMIRLDQILQVAPQHRKAARKSYEVIMNHRPKTTNLKAYEQYE